MEVFESKNRSQTKDLGRDFAQRLRGGGVLALYGDLGAGKTAFVQGLAEGLGIKEAITSPTYVFVRSYKSTGGPTLYHLDLYRLNPANESAEDRVDLAEIFSDPRAIVAVEWAEKIESRLPRPTVKLFFEYASFGRQIRIVFPK